MLNQFFHENAAPAALTSGTIQTPHAIDQGSVDTNDTDDCIRNLRSFNDIAHIEVGVISSVRSKTIESVQSLGDYLTDIQSGKYMVAVEGYRSLISGKMPIEGKSYVAKQYKATLPCCVPHSNCTTASIDNKLPQNGIMQVDMLSVACLQAT